MGDRDKLRCMAVSPAKSAIVLLSGGLDSLVSIAEAVRRDKKVMALTFDYGQRAAEREIEASKKICRYYGVEHRVIRLDWLKEVSSTPLIKKRGTIPAGDTSPEKGARIVWVPNRNGVMLNIAAAIAEAMGYKKVVIGTNIEEGRFFSDNTQGFIDASNRCMSYSTRAGIKVVSYTGRLKKIEILRLGLRLQAPLYYLWSCYKGGRELCLRCHSCGYLVRSLKKEGVWENFWDKRKKHAGWN